MAKFLNIEMKTEGEDVVIEAQGFWACTVLVLGVLSTAVLSIVVIGYVLAQLLHWLFPIKGL